jgi:hypothetical protein
VLDASIGHMMQVRRFAVTSSSMSTTSLADAAAKSKPLGSRVAAAR